MFSHRCVRPIVFRPGDKYACADSSLIYYAQNATYLGPIAGTHPSPVTAAVGFNENATLPFQVRAVVLDA